MKQIKEQDMEFGINYCATHTNKHSGERFYETVFLRENEVLYTTDVQTGEYIRFYSWSEEHLPNDITFWVMEE